MREHKKNERHANSTIRLARAADAADIAELLSVYSEKGMLLPLSTSMISASISKFIVADLDSRIVGCVALRDFGDNLFEVRSLAVEESLNGRGLGSNLVLSLIKTFNLPDGARLFALTYRPEFFERLGFARVKKDLFPQKIWSDCEKCPKKEHCDEQAVLANLPLPR